MNKLKEPVQMMLMFIRELYLSKIVIKKSVTVNYLFQVKHQLS